MVELLLMGQKMDLYDYTGMLGKYICYESGVLNKCWIQGHGIQLFKNYCSFIDLGLDQSKL